MKNKRPKKMKNETWVAFFDRCKKWSKREKEFATKKIEGGK